VARWLISFSNCSIHAVDALAQIRQLRVHRTTVVRELEMLA
jgi:hypothetical protein